MNALRIRFSCQNEHGIGFGDSIQALLIPLRALHGVCDYVIESQGPHGWSEITHGTLINQ